MRISEEEVIRLENDPKDPLLPFCYAFRSNGMREYHIDTHPSFLDRITFALPSIRKPMCIRAVIIIGQDETVFKQYSFSAKCWYNNLGATKLLPKTDGISVMLSAFVSRMFGMGLVLNDIQLEEINERRRSNEWKECVSAERAMEVYGKTTKKPLTCKHVVLQYFDLGIQNDGYWGYLWYSPNMTMC